MPNLELQKLGKHIRLVTFTECGAVDEHATKLENLFQELRKGCLDGISFSDVFTLADKASFFAMIFERDDHSYQDIPSLDPEPEPLSFEEWRKQSSRELRVVNDAQVPEPEPIVSLLPSTTTESSNVQARRSASMDEDGFPLASGVNYVEIYGPVHSVAHSSAQEITYSEGEPDLVDPTSSSFGTPPETAPGTPLESEYNQSPAHHTTNPNDIGEPSFDGNWPQPSPRVLSPRVRDFRLSRIHKWRKAQKTTWDQDQTRRRYEDQDSKKPIAGCIGFIYLVPSGDQDIAIPSPGEVNFGIVLEQQYREKGYAFEAASLVIAWAFETLNYHRIQAVVLDTPRNIRAITFFTQLHFGHEGTRRLSAYCTRTQEWKDVTYLAILDTDWIMRSYHKPAPRSAWDELFARHQAEREKLLLGDDLRLKRTSSMETIRVGKKKARNFEDEELERAIALSLLESSSVSSSASSAGIATPSTPSMITSGISESSWDTLSHASLPATSDSEFEDLMGSEEYFMDSGED